MRFCPSEDVDTFEVHHLNGQPDNNDLLNLLLVCPTCHTKITSGEITINDTYRKKQSLMEAKTTKAEQASPSISISNVSGTTIIGNNNTIITKRAKTIRQKTYPDGSIGADNNKANYLSYLVDKYAEYAAWGHQGVKAYYIMPSMLKKHFKLGGNRSYFHIPIARFDEAVAFVQGEILNTKLGRVKKTQQLLFSTFEEYLSKQSPTH